MGGKKKQTVGYKYFLGQHMILCHGPIDKVIEVLADDKTAWTGSNVSGSIYVNAPNLFGGEDGEGGIVGNIDFEFGGLTQGQNPYLVSKLSPELVPSFRGVAGAVFKQVYIGTQAYLKKIGFRASRIHTTQSEGLTQWYDAKSEITFDDNLGVQIGQTSKGWSYLQVPSSDTADYSAEDVDYSSWSIGQTPFANKPGHPYSAGGDFPPVKNTNWDLNTKIWVRKQFDVSSVTGFTLTVFVDNFATVWINGFLVLPRAGSDTAPSTASFLHDIVVTSDVLRAGKNTIVLLAEDDTATGPGAYTYVAFKIEAAGYVQLDMNPAHIIRECLTNPDWGMGYQDADIDDVSFMAAADKLYEEKMGMSLLWNKQTTIEEFIGEIIKHIDASIYVDKSTGKFRLKLVRFDYDESELIILNPSNVHHISDFTRPSFGELTNSITVTYIDCLTGKDSSVTIQDIALSQMQGVTINTTQQYPGFSNAIIASRVAQRDLKTLSTPIASCTIYANRDAYPLNIGDVFKLTWPDYGITELVMRATGIAYGDGKSNQIRLSATQDVYALPSKAIIIPTPPVWIDPNDKPRVATKRLIYEVPYLEAIQQNGQAAVDAAIAADNSIGYAGAAAGRPIGSALNASMNVNSGGGYEKQATVDFSPTAKLVSDIGKMATSFNIKDQDNIDSVVLGTWFQIDNEIMSIVSYVDSIITVKRGLLDTVPENHLLDSVLYFWDNYSVNDETQYVDGETLSIKITPVTGVGELPLLSAPTDTLNIVGRLARPYPPANLKINGEYFPNTVEETLKLSWAHRDRLLQTSNSYLGFTDSSIGPEPGTTYTVAVYDLSDIIVLTQSNITADNFDLSSLSAGVYKIKVSSFRENLKSYQDQLITVAYINNSNTNDYIIYPSLVANDTLLVTKKSKSSPFVFELYETQDGLNYIELSGPIPKITRLPSFLKSLNNGIYIYIYFEDFENFDDGYIVKGSVGSTPEITSTLFSKPNMPVSIGSTGTKFLILTRENKVYSSLDGYTFSYDGIADIGFSLINERQIFLQYHNDRWFFSSSGNLYFTENITALSGWTKSNLSSSQIIPGDNIFANYDSTMFAMCIRRVGFSSNSVILKSIDYGVNWIAIKDLTENQLYANIFNIGGILISVKYGYFRKTIISYDGGTSWNDYTNDLIECDVKSQYHVQFGNKLFVSVTNIITEESKIMYTENGINFYDVSDNFITNRITEDGNTRITESGDIRTI